MDKDAREAAKAIMETRRANQEKPGLIGPFLNAFKVPRWALFLFSLVAVTEIFTNTMIVLFDVIDNKTTIYQVLVLATPVRLAVFIFVSVSQCKKNWWRYWVTFDNLLLLTVTVSIVYGFLLLKSPRPEDAGDLTWRIASVALLPVIMTSFNGNFRIMVKMFPWTPGTIVVYKFLRLYAVVMGTVVQLNLRGKDVGGMDPALLILYVSSQVSYHVSLLSRIPSWTAWQRMIESKAKAAQATGAPLVLDDSSTTHDRHSHIHDLHHLPYDEEDDESAHYHHAQSHTPLLKHTDDITVPVNVTTVTQMRTNPSGLMSSDDQTDSEGYL